MNHRFIIKISHNVIVTGYFIKRKKNDSTNDDAKKINE